MKKYIHQFKQGDVVSFHGARFEILHDARESQGHRPQQGHLTAAHGPSAVAYTVGRWIDGQTVTGYFGPNQDWTFQGNITAGQYDVNNRTDTHTLTIGDSTMDAEKLDALWELHEEANQALKALRDVIWKADHLGLPSANDAWHLYMKLKPVLHEAGRIAYDNDAQAQHEALDAQAQHEAE